MTMFRVLMITGATLLVGSAAFADGEGEKKAATKDDYVLDTSATSADIKVGSDGTFSIAIRAKNGLKVHPQAPLDVKLKTTDGLKPQKTKLGRADAKDAEAKDPHLSTALRADRAGAHSVEASVSFFLCSPAWCQRMTDKVTVAVQATP